MNTVELNGSNFESTVGNDGIVVVDCWASWCGACKQFTPIFERVAGQNPDLTFAKLNTQAENELTRNLGIEHIPTLMVYRDGIQVFSQPGNYTEDGLTDIIKQARSLDMDMVKREVAADGTADEKTNAE